MSLVLLSSLYHKKKTTRRILKDLSTRKKYSKFKKQNIEIVHMHYYISNHTISARQFVLFTLFLGWITVKYYSQFKQKKNTKNTSYFIITLKKKQGPKIKPTRATKLWQEKREKVKIQEIFFRALEDYLPILKVLNVIFQSFIWLLISLTKISFFLNYWQKSLCPLMGYAKGWLNKPSKTV